MSASSTLFHQTPTLHSLPLSRQANVSVWLKMECNQPAGSFKIRGMDHLCRDLKKAGKQHFISSSGGNAGYSAAYAGRLLGCKVTVIVPETTDESVRALIREQQAEVLVHGKVWDEADLAARKLASAPEAAYIPPFDHPLLWEGHSTMIDECVQQMPKPEAVVLSVGGGGLLCGVLEGLRNNNWQDVPVFAVETQGTASLATSIRQGRLVTLPEINSIAKTLGARRVAQAALEQALQHAVQPHLVTDRQALDACQRFAHDHRVSVEPSCGAALSVVYHSPQILGKAKSVLVIVCGGVGASLDMFQSS